MLQDLLVALLGFTGDVIVEREDTFSVVEGFDLLSISEREAMNKICPLGWFYVKLRLFSERHAVQWGSSSSEDGFQSYLAAISAGLGDFLHEYVADVSALEHQILSEGPLPLSYLATSLQKYLVAMPALHTLCCEMDARRLRGGQIIDFLSTYKSGIPLLSSVVQRMTRRVRIVFLKQCMAWMLFGELHDPGSEFLIVRRDGVGRHGGGGGGTMMASATSSFGAIYDGVMKRFVKNKTGGGGCGGGSGNGNGSGSGGVGPQSKHAFANTTFGAGGRDDAFDWNTGFMLRFERLPESYVSPSLASKILFCGKATKLLKGKRKEGGQGPAGNHGSFASAFGWMPTSDADIYSYLCGRHGSGTRGGGGSSSSSSGSGRGSGSPGKGAQASSSSASSSASSRPPLSTAADLGPGLTPLFERAMTAPDQSLETFEKLIDSVYDDISASLWHYLRDEFAFVDYLHLIRNTYLMGCGELFKFVSDQIVTSMLTPTPRPPEPRDAQVHLNLVVLRESAKALDLDEQTILRVLKVCCIICCIYYRLCYRLYYRLYYRQPPILLPVLTPPPPSSACCSWASTARACASLTFRAARLLWWARPPWRNAWV